MVVLVVVIGGGGGGGGGDGNTSSTGSKDGIRGVGVGLTTSSITLAS